MAQARIDVKLPDRGMLDEIRRCAAAQGISATEWARLHDRFLVVHDRLSAKELKNLEVCDLLNEREFRRIIL